MNKVAAYLRLSDEDGDKMESDSIANQRSLIREHLKKMPDMELVEEFVDDGYTGTNFDRPSFKRMVEAAKNHKIDCIIVKDLSRFGRNYIESGRYLERIFPMLGVRFISILDNYDTAKKNDSDQILIEFKNIMNDAYCRDISMKIRSSLDNKRKNGQFIGSFATYGYKKDVDNRNKLVIDEYPAEIVQHIFRLLLNGYSIIRIMEQLNTAGVPTPMDYKRMCGMNYNSGFRGVEKLQWSITAVRRILKSEIYTGTMVQNKRKKINYKIKESRNVDESEWIKVEGTHEAIIPRQIFDTVQELLTLDTRTAPNQEKLYLFSGMIKCESCGENMIRRNSHKRKDGQTTHSFVCSTYVRHGGCDSHNILEKRVESAVLKTVQNQVSLLSEAEQVIEQVRRQPEGQISVQLYDKQIAEAEAVERRYLNLKTSLYQHMCDGEVSREEYLDMSARFSKRVEAARNKKKELEASRKAVLTNCEIDAPWMENFKAAAGIEKLDRNTVTSLIDRIIVHSRDEIEIVFKFGDEIENYIAFADECKERLAETNRLEAAV